MSLNSPTELRHREDQLKEILVDKYRGRFSSENKQADEVSLSSAAIGHEVDRLVGASVPITEANLSRLERRLQHHAHLPPDGDVQSVISFSAYTTGSQMGSMRQRSSRGHTPFSTASPRGPMTPGRGGSFRAGTSSSSRAASTPRPRTAALGLGALPEHGQYGSLSSARGSSAIGRGASGASAGHNGGGGPASVSSSAPGAGGLQASLDWSVLDRLAGQMHKRDAAVHKAREKEIKQRLRHDLDRQMEDAHLKQEREKEEAQRYHEMQEDALHHWRQQEAASTTAKKALVMNTQLARDEQLGNLRSMRERQRQAEIQEAQAAEECYHRENENLNRQAADRWKQRRETAQKALIVSSESAKVREEMVKKQEDLEQQLVVEHEQHIAKREQMIKDTQAKQKQAKESRSKAVFKEIAAAQNQKKPFDDNPDLEANTANMLLRREKEDQKRAAALRQATQSYLQDQIRAKASAKQQEQSMKRQVRALQEMDAKDHQYDMHLKNTERRLLNSEHRTELERQIAAKMTSAPRGDVMSEAELRLNRDLLERVNRALTEISVPPSTAGTV